MKWKLDQNNFFLKFKKFQRSMWLNRFWSFSKSPHICGVTMENCFGCQKLKPSSMRQTGTLGSHFCMYSWYVLCMWTEINYSIDWLMLIQDDAYFRIYLLQRREPTMILKLVPSQNQTKLCCQPIRNVRYSWLKLLWHPLWWLFSLHISWLYQGTQIWLATFRNLMWPLSPIHL